MSTGGSTFSPAFKGTWYDLYERKNIEETQRYIVNKEKKTITAYNFILEDVKYKEQKITSAEEIASSTNVGIGNCTVPLFNERVLPNNSLPENGIDRPYSKRMTRAIISFDIDGVATCTIEFTEEKCPAIRSTAIQNIPIFNSVGKTTG